MDLEELNIQHGLPGRPESPTLETSARKAIETAMRELIQGKLLYQKIVVDLSGLGAAFAKAKVNVDPAKIAILEGEVSKRPWKLETHHMGDDQQHAEIHRYANIGAQPIGTPIEKMSLHFYAPSVQLSCRACKSKTTFIALKGSHERLLGYPFPRTTERGAEHVYTVFYRCETCRELIHAVLVRREGLRLHLCGFAPRREQTAERSVPKAVEKILVDASNAVAEGDLSAGFYHLRTMLEHYVKFRLSIPLDFQIRGDELIAKHYDSLPINLRHVLPSLTIAYETLSKHLHGRTGEVSNYYALFAVVCDHIEGIELLAKYKS